MRLTIVANTLQMNRILHPAAPVVVNRVTRLMGMFVATKSLAGECEHLRHEGEIFQAAVFVERGQDLFAAADLHPIPGPQIQIPGRIQIVSTWDCISPSLDFDLDCWGCHCRSRRITDPIPKA